MESQTEVQQRKYDNYERDTIASIASASDILHTANVGEGRRQWNITYWSVKDTMNKEPNSERKSERGKTTRLSKNN